MLVLMTGQLSRLIHRDHTRRAGGRRHGRLVLGIQVSLVLDLNEPHHGVEGGVDEAHPAAKHGDGLELHVQPAGGLEQGHERDDARARGGFAGQLHHREQAAVRVGGHHEEQHRPRQPVGGVVAPPHGNPHAQVADDAEEDAHGQLEQEQREEGVRRLVEVLGLLLVPASAREPAHRGGVDAVAREGEDGEGLHVEKALGLRKPALACVEAHARQEQPRDHS
mmetsp:Transcript_3093/g.6086  ORF Transcript_3093/g.6086 Transcript_3093/m.6086 type:complete len:222 (-) Transcript_3093:271-936(-)